MLCACFSNSNYLGRAKRDVRGARTGDSFDVRRSVCVCGVSLSSLFTKQSAQSNPTGTGERQPIADCRLPYILVPGRTDAVPVRCIFLGQTSFFRIFVCFFVTFATWQIQTYIQIQVRIHWRTTDFFCLGSRKGKLCIRWWKERVHGAAQLCRRRDVAQFPQQPLRWRRKVHPFGTSSPTGLAFGRTLGEENSNDLFLLLLLDSM